MTAPTKPARNAARVYNLHLWGYGWWCEECLTGVDRYSPRKHWAPTEASARAFADLHRCD